MIANNDGDPQLSPAAQAYYSNKSLFYRNIGVFLFGTFGMGLALGVAGNLIPLHMDRVGMSATQIALGFSINGWLVAFLMVYIAFRSDHCQSKLGRRIPFLVLGMPPVILSLLIFPHTYTVLTCAAAFAAYRFFLNFKEQTYGFLSYDISPKKYWGRLLAIQAAGTAVGGWLANVGLMQLVPVIGETYVFYIAAALLMLSTIISILFIKEPPIHIPIRPKFDIIKQLKIGFGNKRNWPLFIGFGCCVVVMMPSPTFMVLQAKRNVMLNEAQIGWVMSWMTLTSFVIAYPSGWITDKLGALPTILLGYAIALLACTFAYPAKDATTLTIGFVLFAIGTALMWNAMGVFLVYGVPRAILASFCACNGMFFAFFSATMQVVFGKVIDIFGRNYALAFPLGAAFGLIGVPLLLMVAYWRKKTTQTELNEAYLRAAGVNLAPAVEIEETPK